MCKRMYNNLSKLSRVVRERHKTPSFGHMGENNNALRDFKNINSLTYSVSSRNTAKSAQIDFSELGHLMASVSTNRHEKSCFFSLLGPVGSVRVRFHITAIAGSDLPWRVF